MMLRNLIITVSLSVGIGSFIYLLNGVLGVTIGVNPPEIISVWIASALIGIASVLHHTQMAGTLVMVIQLGTGIMAFSTIAVFNGWIALNTADVIFYAGVILLIMLFIFLVFYLLSVLDSRKINEKLNEK